jgi:hypothetical protein
MLLLISVLSLTEFTNPNHASGDKIGGLKQQNTCLAASRKKRKRGLSTQTAF